MLAYRHEWNHWRTMKRMRRSGKVGAGAVPSMPVQWLSLLAWLSAIVLVAIFWAAVVLLALDLGHFLTGL